MAELLTIADLTMPLGRGEPESPDPEGSYLTGLIMAARVACEKRIGRTIVGGERTAVLDRFPSSGFIELPGGALATVESIKFFTGPNTFATMDPDGYWIDEVSIPGRLFASSSWPSPVDQAGAVRIAYTLAPLSDDDAAIARQAMLMLVAHWYNNREAATADARSAPAEMPLSVSFLLQPLSVMSA